MRAPLPELIDARCGRHPLREAAVQCVRCGGFACTHCLELIEGSPYCSRCRLEHSSAERVPTGLLLAVLFGVAGLVIWIPAIAAVFLAGAELKAIRERRAPASRHRFAIIVYGFGCAIALGYPAGLLLLILRARS